MLSLRGSFKRDLSLLALSVASNVEAEHLKRIKADGCLLVSTQLSQRHKIQHSEEVTFGLSQRAS